MTVYLFTIAEVTVVSDFLTSFLNFKNATAGLLKASRLLACHVKCSFRSDLSEFRLTIFGA